MKGKNKVRFRPFLYRSSGGRFEVVTITTPPAKSISNSRPTTMASVMSLICISSKANNRTSAMIWAAKGAKASGVPF